LIPRGGPCPCRLGTLPAPEPEAGTWEAGIAIDPRDKRLRIAVERGEGTGGSHRAAATDYRVVERTPGGQARLELRPRTGRTHQLRVHCAHAGAPLLGDVQYGGPRRITLPDGRVVTPRRVMLCCAALSLPDVARGRGTLELEEALPEDMSAIWRALVGSP